VKVLVIGGGIGGLTAAIALRKRGIEADVYEQTATLREVGAGISLWPNAVKALHYLGLGEKLRSISHENAEFVLRRWNGDVISRTATPELERRFGGGVVIVHRAELLDILAGAFGSERLHLGQTCSGFEEDTGRVSARFADGETVRADVLVGADGLHSVVRTCLGHRDRIRYSGYTAWRSVVRFDFSAIVPSETWGPGKRFGIHPMKDGRVYWYATNNAPEGERDSNPHPKEKLLSLFKGWHDPIEALIRASDSTLLQNDIYYRDPQTGWGRGGVTLLGDAAHPMTPDLGQGACQAIEDALELASFLQSGANVAAGLKRYEATRIPRTTSIVLASRRMGLIGQVNSPLLCRLRDLALRHTPEAVTLRSLAPILAYEGHLEG
jgi:2-polyprenyl-6-methoxyphenol hydroxylase-like FAD-dependent oxidoreductase